MEPYQILTTILVSLFIYFLVGVSILVSIDKNNELFNWYASAPGDWLKIIVLILWPLVLIFYFYGRKRNDNARRRD
jgi:succinate dehydrogenase/fumarate reductase cytochrome b subunit